MNYSSTTRTVPYGRMVFSVLMLMLMLLCWAGLSFSDLGAAFSRLYLIKPKKKGDLLTKPKATT